jgi:hypothetical protein
MRLRTFFEHFGATETFSTATCCPAARSPLKDQKMAHGCNSRAAAAMGNGESNYGPQEIRDVMDGLCLTEAVQVSNESASSFLEGVRADARHTFFPEVMDVSQPESTCQLLNLQRTMMKNCAIDLFFCS